MSDETFYFPVALPATRNSRCGVCGRVGVTYWVNDPYALGLSHDAEWGQWCAACLKKQDPA